MSGIRLKRLHGRLGQVVFQLTRTHFSRFVSPEGWCPLINAYQFRDRVQICVDLAGVEPSEIDVRVEGRRLIIRGHRRLPEPSARQKDPVQILALEIDHGPFVRQVLLPVEVDQDAITAEQRQGFLWIDLPFLSNA